MGADQDEGFAGEVEVAQHLVVELVHGQDAVVDFEAEPVVVVGGGDGDEPGGHVHDHGVVDGGEGERGVEFLGLALGGFGGVGPVGGHGV